MTTPEECLLVSRETAEKLDSYRAFRDVFRNVYGFYLSPIKMRELLENLAQTSVALRTDLDRFAANCDPRVASRMPRKRPTPDAVVAPPREELSLPRRRLV